MGFITLPPQGEPESKSVRLTSGLEPDATGVSPPPGTVADDPQGTLPSSAEGVTGEMIAGGTLTSAPAGGVAITLGSRKEKVHSQHRRVKKI